MLADFLAAGKKNYAALCRHQLLQAGRASPAFLAFLDTHRSAPWSARSKKWTSYDMSNEHVNAIVAQGVRGIVTEESIASTYFSVMPCLEYIQSINTDFAIRTPDGAVPVSPLDNSRWTDNRAEWAGQLADLFDSHGVTNTGDEGDGYLFGLKMWEWPIDWNPTCTDRYPVDGPPAAKPPQYAPDYHISWADDWLHEWPAVWPGDAAAARFVLGQVVEGSRVTLLASLKTIDEVPSMLRKGQQGTVTQIDQDGDALVDFDDEDTALWVAKGQFRKLVTAAVDMVDDV
eukprot:gene11521-3221_t